MSKTAPRSQEQIKQEISRIESEIAKPGSFNGHAFNRDTIEQLEAQRDVLRDRMSERQIERWYVDETTEEYSDGDNDLYHEAMRAYRWMSGEGGDSLDE